MRINNHYSDKLDRYYSQYDRWETDDIYIVSWLFCVLIEDSNYHRKLAAKMIADLVRKSTYNDIIQISVSFRQSYTLRSISWRKYYIHDLLTSEMTDEEERAITILASLHANGFIRQRAVELLCQFEGTLPFIILRQNDWVPQVRESAYRSLITHMQTVDQKELIYSISYLDKLRRSKRCSYSQIIDPIYRMLDLYKLSNTLSEGLEHSSLNVRRFYINYLIHSAEQNQSVLIKHIQVEKDPFLRKLIFMSLVKTTVDLTALCKVLLHDKYPHNRYIALQYLSQNKLSIAITYAKKMLLDKHTSLRALSRQIITENELHFDFAEFYISHIGISSAGAILGLGEVGNADDAFIVAEYLYADCPSIVKAAMITLMRLDPEKYFSTITELLLSEQCSTVNMAKRLLEKYRTLDYNRIHQIYLSTPYDHTKMKCLQLLLLSSKWQRLIYILSAMISSSENIYNLCMDQLSNWITRYNLSYTLANEAERIKIYALLEDAGCPLDQRTKDQILFYLS